MVNKTLSTFITYVNVYCVSIIGPSVFSNMVIKLIRKIFWPRYTIHQLKKQCLNYSTYFQGDDKCQIIFRHIGGKPTNILQFCKFENVSWNFDYMIFYSERTNLKIYETIICPTTELTWFPPQRFSYFLSWWSPMSLNSIQGLDR